jgi:hypothetical protein
MGTQFSSRSSVAATNYPAGFATEHEMVNRGVPTLTTLLSQLGLSKHLKHLSLRWRTKNIARGKLLSLRIALLF